MTTTSPLPSDLTARARRGGPDGDRGLTRAERSARTTELLREARECSDPERRLAVLDQVIAINRGVAESVASRYRDRGIELADLHQVAYVGLTRAVRRYDSDRAEDLLTYAVPTIRGEIQRFFRDHSWAVRPTRRVQELQWQVNREIGRLAQQLGREPSDTEVREALDLSYEEYAEAIAAFGCFQPTSLDQRATAESDTTLGELIGEEQPVDAVEARVVLEPVLRRLSERDRRILHLRFVEDLTQAEIGEQFGVTQMQVSRLLKRILRNLREGLEDPADEVGR